MYGGENPLEKEIVNLQTRESFDYVSYYVKLIYLFILNLSTSNFLLINVLFLILFINVMYIKFLYIDSISSKKEMLMLLSVMSVTLILFAFVGLQIIQKGWDYNYIKLTIDY